jgi:hypothetical protein
MRVGNCIDYDCATMTDIGALIAIAARQTMPPG